MPASAYVEGMMNKFELFRAPEISKQIDGAIVTTYRPVDPLTKDQPIIFNITGTEDYLIDGTSLKLRIRGKFMEAKAAGDVAIDLAHSEHFYPCNNFMHSLFKQVDCYFNDHQMTEGSETYSQKAMFEKLLNFNAAYKKHALLNVLWAKDNAAQMEGFVTPKADDKNTNDASVIRGAYVAESKVVEMIDHLHIDCLNTEQYILNNISIRIRLLPQNYTYYTMGKAGTENYYFKISEATIEVVRIKPTNSMLLSIASELQLQPARYTNTIGSFKVRKILTGESAVHLDDVFLQQIPNAVVLGMLSVKAVEGDLKTNPHKFAHNQLTSASVFMNGTQLPPLGYTMDFENNVYLRCYTDLLQITGNWNNNKNIGISREDYKNGHTLLAFDLTKGQIINTNFFKPGRRGSVRIEMRFKKALTESQYLFIYGMCDHEYFIDNTYSVTKTW